MAPRAIAISKLTLLTLGAAAILDGNAADAVVTNDRSSCPGLHAYYRDGHCRMVWHVPSWCPARYRHMCGSNHCQMTCNENFRSMNPRSSDRYERTSRPYTCSRYTSIRRNTGSCQQMTSQRVANASFERTGDWSMRFTCNEHFLFANGEQTAGWRSGHGAAPTCICTPSVASATVSRSTDTIARIACDDGLVVNGDSSPNAPTETTFDCTGTEAPPSCEPPREVVPSVTAPLVVSGGVDIYDNVCQFGCLGESVSPSLTSLGFALGTATSVTDANGLSGPGFYPCSGPDDPAVDVCTCEPNIANATVTPTYQTGSQIPAGYPAGWRRSVAADVVCDAGLVFRGLRGPFQNNRPGLAPVTSLTWNCLSNDSGTEPATITHRSCSGRGIRNGCGDATYAAPAGLACEAGPGCPHMPVGSCETTGDDPTNLDCILDCPANYVVNNSPSESLPLTWQCLVFELESFDFESCVCRPSMPSRSGRWGGFGRCNMVPGEPHLCMPTCRDERGRFYSLTNADGSPLQYDCRSGEETPTCP